jgi:hypothetical protein
VIKRLLRRLLSRPGHYCLLCGGVWYGSFEACMAWWRHKPWCPLREKSKEAST